MTANSTDKKYSGVNWLGEIPASWNITALKRVLSEPLKYGATEAGDCDDQSLPRYIRITDFDDRGALRDDTFASLPKHIACEYFLKDGDLLFARSGATVGKTFLFHNYSGLACFAGYLIKEIIPNLTGIGDRGIYGQDYACGSFQSSPWPGCLCMS